MPVGYGLFEAYLRLFSASMETTALLGFEDPVDSWTHLFGALAVGVLQIILFKPNGVGRRHPFPIVTYGFSCIFLLSMSGVYHLLSRDTTARYVMRILDHAGIFLLIAGSYTPITVLCLAPEKATLLLWLVWGGAALGIGFRIFWIGAPRWLYVPLYILLGWAAMMYIVDFFTVSPVMMTLIMVGGIFYTVGAVAYALKRPNPFPGRFGFHEVFHTFTMLAYLCHWTAIFIVATNPPVL